MATFARAQEGRPPLAKAFAPIIFDRVRPLGGAVADVDTLIAGQGVKGGFGGAVIVLIGGSGGAVDLLRHSVGGTEHGRNAFLKDRHRLPVQVVERQHQVIL